MKKIALCLLFSSIGLLTGCGESGPPLGEVTGKVTLDGEPLPHARIEFQPVEEGKSPSYAYTNDAGEYELRYGRDQLGAVVGEHRVRITSYREERHDDGTFTVVPERVPTKYNSQTTLTRTVEEGSQEINFELAGALDAPAG